VDSREKERTGRWKVSDRGRNQGLGCVSLALAVFRQMFVRRSDAERLQNSQSCEEGSETCPSGDEEADRGEVKGSSETIS
jgi:hypothetical protein